MATIERRSNSDGKAIFRVKVRLKAIHSKLLPSNA